MKNSLVIAAPVSAGLLTDTQVLGPTAIAFGGFCLVASSVYLINDVADLADDRRHPTKRFRPLAAGELTVPTALALATVLLVAGLAIAAATNRWLAVVLATYAAISLLYSLGLKNQPVLDLAMVASGFMLRAMAGGVAAGLTLSHWFLLAAAFGSLFVVTGKRYSEALLMGEGETSTRASLGGYSLSYLRFVWTFAATITVATYILWSLEMTATFEHPILAQVSIAPFVLGLLRYAVDVDRGLAGAPEDLVLRDRVLLSLGVAWLLLFVIGVTGGL